MQPRQGFDQEKIKITRHSLASLAYAVCAYCNECWLSWRRINQACHLLTSFPLLGGRAPGPCRGNRALLLLKCRLSPWRFAPLGESRGKTSPTKNIKIFGGFPRLRVVKSYTSVGAFDATLRASHVPCLRACVRHGVLCGYTSSRSPTFSHT